MRNKLTHKRILMLIALVVFLMTALSAVGINSWIGYGWHTEYTVSRYVGLETWSVVLFALGNVVVAITMLYYLYAWGERLRMRKCYYWVVVIMLIGLIGLSACPIGYFDPLGTKYASSSVSKIHEICSRLMFLMMLLVVSVVACCRTVTKRTKMTAVLFVLYGVLCVGGFMMKMIWFCRLLLIFEALYLIGFMLWCLGLQVQNDTRKSKINKKEGYGKRSPEKA